MFDNFEVTIIRVEGLGNISKAVCIMIVDEKPIESVSLKSLENSHVSSIPSRGELRLCIEEQTILASVRFDLSIIRCQGYHWLPLFLDSHNLLTEVPEEVGLPRILLIFNSRKFLSPVIEITETSEISENAEIVDYNDLPAEELSKNVELRIRIMELEQTFQSEKIKNSQIVEKMARDYKASLDKLSFEVEKHKIWNENYKKKCNELMEELEVKNKNISEVNDEKELLNAELNVFKNKYEELLRNQESIFMILEAKDQEISALKIPVEAQPKLLEFSKQESISVVKVHNGKKESSVERPNQKKKLIDFSIDKGHSDKALALNNYSDQVEFYLNESLHRLKLEGFFVRSNEQYYKIGTRKVGITLKNGSIYCKVGDALKTLENYIYSNCTKELENFIKKRANPKPTHRRFHTFSSSFDHTSLEPSRSFRKDSDHKISKVVVKPGTPLLVKKPKK